MQSKVAVTIEEDLLREVDAWVRAGEFASRSRAVQEGLGLLRNARSEHQSLLSELAKLIPDEERMLAEEWLAGEVDWNRS